MGSVTSGRRKPETHRLKTGDQVWVPLTPNCPRCQDIAAFRLEKGIYDKVHRPGEVCIGTLKHKALHELRVVPS